MRKYVFYPILLGLYPVLYLFAINFGITSFSTAVWPLLISIGGTLIVWLFASLWLKNRHKAGIAVALILFLFFSYGHVHSFIYAFLVDYEVDVGGRHDAYLLYKTVLFWALAYFWVLIFVLLKPGIRRLFPETLAKITYVLNAMSIVLLLMPMLTILFHLPGGDDSSTRPGRSLNESVLSDTVEKLGYSPDIYNIILDGYSRADVLKKYYKFDNSEFLGFLEKKGFSVTKNSGANYYWTVVSLSSMLSMDYLDHFKKNPGSKSKDMSVPFKMIRDSKVARFLKRRGYRTVHLNSTWGATMTNPYADEMIPCSSGIYHKEFYRVLAETTAMKIWESRVDSDLAECHLTNIETLKNIAPSKGPKFVFAHFVPPHHPYLFDREGNILRRATVSNQFEFQKRLWKKTDKYVDQTVYFNKRMKEVVDSILKKSKNPPVIILQSDHGSHIITGKTQYKERVNARFSILLATYTPGAKDLFPDDTSPVNIYRYLLNRYFSAELPILKNKHYTSGYKRPYQFKSRNYPYKISK